MAHEERRTTPRIRVSVRAAYQAEGESKRGNVYDLGLGGVFICTSEPLDPGSHLCLTLETPGEEVPVEADGQVVWTNLVETEAVPAGMGIRFLRVDPMAQQRLARHLESLVLSLGVFVDFRARAEHADPFSRDPSDPSPQAPRVTRQSISSLLRPR